MDRGCTARNILKLHDKIVNVKEFPTRQAIGSSEMALLLFFSDCDFDLKAK